MLSLRRGARRMSGSWVVRRPGARRAVPPKAQAGAVLLVLAAVIGSFAQACRSGSSPGASPVTPGSAAAVASPAATSLDPNSFQLETVTGVSNSYSIAIPAGWTADDPTAPGGFARRYVLKESGTTVVQILVRCQMRASIDDMMNADARIVSARGGPIPGPECEHYRRRSPGEASGLRHEL